MNAAWRGPIVRGGAGTRDGQSGTGLDPNQNLQWSTGLEIGRQMETGNNVGRCMLAAMLLAVASGGVIAQGNSASMDAPVLVVDVCKRDVMKYQSNIELVRKSLGDKAAAELDAKFMDKAQWDATLLTHGYCGIARKLREQKLTK